MSYQEQHMPKSSPKHVSTNKSSSIPQSYPQTESLISNSSSPQEKANKYKKYQDLIHHPEIWKMVMNGEDHVFGRFGYDITRYYINSYESSETYTTENGKNLNFPLFNTQQPVLHPLSDESQTFHKITDNEIFGFIIQNQLVSNPQGEEYIKEIKSKTNINNIEIPYTNSCHVLMEINKKALKELNLSKNCLTKTNEILYPSQSEKLLSPSEILNSTQQQALLIQFLEKLNKALEDSLKNTSLGWDTIIDISKTIDKTNDYINDLKKMFILKTTQEDINKKNIDQISQIVVFLKQTANETNKDSQEWNENAKNKLNSIYKSYKLEKQAEQQIENVLKTAQELEKSFANNKENIPILNFNNRIENLLNQLKNNQKILPEILPEYINMLKFEALRNCSNTKLP